MLIPFSNHFPTVGNFFFFLIPSTCIWNFAVFTFNFTLWQVGCWSVGLKIYIFFLHWFIWIMFFFGRGGGEKVTTPAVSNFESENLCQAVVVPARFRVSIQAVCCELHAFESSQSGEVLLRLPPCSSCREPQAAFPLQSRVQAEKVPCSRGSITPGVGSWTFHSPSASQCAPANGL